MAPAILRRDTANKQGTYPLVAKMCWKCLQVLMSVAKQKRRIAVSSNWRTMVPFKTWRNKLRSFDQVKVLDIDVKIVLINCRANRTLNKSGKAHELSIMFDCPPSQLTTTLPADCPEIIAHCGLGQSMKSTIIPKSMLIWVAYKRQDSNSTIVCGSESLYTSINLF